MIASGRKLNKPRPRVDGGAVTREPFRSDALQSIAAEVIAKLRSKEVDRAMALRDACNRNALRQRSIIGRKVPQDRFSHSEALRRYAARRQDEAATAM